MPLPHRTRRRSTSDPAVPAARTAPSGAESAHTTEEPATGVPSTAHAPGASDSARTEPEGTTPRPEAAHTPVAPTRASTAWAGVWVAAILLIAFIVFIMQNTESIEIQFFGLEGTVPLAIGLLTALVVGIVITLAVGTARIVQMRRIARRRRG